ncbi:hypothetical protein [Aliiglaciecola litoralis]|uniref:STAS/SEC14 domain-containing protein n=1 Tax=Aliiglaciecola litoralis TaxID=582857 RepID=A0ABN1LEV1_9ALTE
MTKVLLLDFAKIIILRDDIAEIVVDEGVEMTSAMVDQYHTCLIENLLSPFSVLINKINTYTYDFQAQLKIGTIENIHAMAVVTYSRHAELATDVMDKTMPRENKWNMQLFSERNVALEWLKEQQSDL